MDACPTCGCHEESGLGRVRAQAEPRRDVEDLREESPERPSRAEFVERGRELIGEYEAHYGRITEEELTSFARLAVVEIQEQDAPWPKSSRAIPKNQQSRATAAKAGAFVCEAEFPNSPARRASSAPGARRQAGGSSAAPAQCGSSPRTASETVLFDVELASCSTSSPTGLPTRANLRVEMPASIRSITARVNGFRSAKYSYVATGSSCSSSTVSVRLVLDGACSRAADLDPPAAERHRPAPSKRSLRLRSPRSGTVTDGPDAGGAGVEIALSTALRLISCPNSGDRARRANVVERDSARQRDDPNP